MAVDPNTTSPDSSSAPATNSVARNLDRARQELLDLGLRNSLINYRYLRARGVEVVDESPAEVLRMLVVEGKKLSFLPRAPDTDDEAAAKPDLPVDDVPAENDPETNTGTESTPAPESDTPVDQARVNDAKSAPKRRADTRLQTVEPDEQLQSRLLRTYYIARSFIEEQGINVLYVAMGMLDWYETQQSETLRRAPLVLVPVELERSNARDRFQVLYSGADIDENLSIASKLKIEYALDAPPFPEPEDFNIDAYFDAWEQVVAGQPRWKIDRDAIALGFFSFGKFLMFRDLDITKWPETTDPAKHRIISSLLTSEGFREPESEISDDAFIDPFQPVSEMRQVVDADSSQTLAIMDINQGRNLVIQGPPGTGKSQTITNVIGEAIGAGKTVLFVAEKMAALEVVKRRLDAVGLGDACLELHSYKMNKRAVLDELRRTLELGKPNIEDHTANLNLLEQTRQRLNDYADAVNAPIGSSNLTPFAAFGTLLDFTQEHAVANWPKPEITGITTWADGEFARRRAMLDELQARLKRLGPPTEHPFWGSQLRTLLPSQQQELGQALSTAQLALNPLREASASLASAMGATAPAGASDVQRIVRGAQLAENAPSVAGVDLASGLWSTKGQEIRGLVDALQSEHDIRGRRTELSADIWNTDLNPLRAELEKARGRWWRSLSGAYRGAKSRLSAFSGGRLPGSVDEQIALVDDVQAAQVQRSIIERGRGLAEALFGSGWNPDTTDSAQLQRISDWALRAHDSIAKGEAPTELLQFIASGKNGAELAPLRQQVELAQRPYSDRMSAVASLLQMDDAEAFATQPFDAVTTDLARMSNQLADIGPMMAFNQSVDLLRQENMAPLAEIAATWHDAPEHLSDLLTYQRTSGLLEQALVERPALNTFDSASQEDAIRTFRELDRLTFAMSQARLALAHWTRLPKHSAGGQLGVLLREFEKKSRHIPVRQLVGRAGNAMQAIKPIFMMSPMSVAAFVPPEALQFDIVIFDEASQVKPVDAFGSLARAKQAVVVGDSKQLPPTSFFDTLVQEEQLEEDDLTGDIESILGLFVAQRSPQRMLRWHYRSRHESLIAVSNREFYESRLMIFPSPDHSRETSGLIFHHLPDTAYDRGGTRANKDEARIVAEAVMDHARNRPKLSLGVAAFSTAQADAVLHEVERLRREDMSTEPFFSAHPYEPFFVKNLENVQGDERDVIFISVGYGKTAEGYVAMNFGPLNANGGERRLNVLITRSKLRCEVFTNLRADDIDLSRTSARGVQAFKTFLQYAETGILDSVAATSQVAESPFEEAVAEALRANGHTIDHQVGTGGFYIDLAVVDPERPGRYMVGIECDGATYHSARSARDRDRLRQQVLEGLGWNIQRVWSTDWFRNPQRELQKLEEAIAKAAAGGASGPTSAPAATPSQFSRVEPSEDERPPVELPPYVEAEPKVRLGQRSIPDVPLDQIAGWIEEVVQIESPIHRDDAVRRVANAGGVTRLGSRIQTHLESAIARAVQRGKVVRRGEFLWDSNMSMAPVRDRTELKNRSIARVAPEEIQLAIATAVSNSFGVLRDQVISDACRSMGFGRVTEETRAHIDPLITAMLASGELVQNGEQLKAGKRTLSF